MKKITYFSFVLFLYVILSHQVKAQCNTGTLYLSYTPTCSGIQESYGGCTYAGEYNNVTLTVGNNYSFGSSITSDFITITNATNVVVASGTQPINYTPTTAGTYRVYIHANAACGTASICRNPWVQCSAAPPPPGPGCNSGPLYTSYTPLCSGTQESYASCTFAGEYNNLTLTAGTAYTFGSSVVSDYITITNGSNVILTSGTQPINYTPTTSGTYRVYIHLSSGCGTSSTCRNPWVQCSTAPPPSAGCNSGVQYLTYTPLCNGTQETYSTCTYAGEYNVLTLTAGTAYSFGSSITSDYITITNAANVILTAGTQPINYTPTASGTYRVYYHTSSACGTASSCRSTWIQCSPPPPPPVSGCNTGVQYLTYTPVCNGTQESYAGCTYAGEYNVLTLNAGTAYTFGSATITDFITITNAANTILTSGTQPINFTPTTSGTYRVYIHLNAACGTENLCHYPWVQCGTAPPPVANDLCGGAIPITPGTYTGTTVGASADIAPSCGSANDGTGGGVWYSVVGNNACSSFTASLCAGTFYDSQIRVFTGPCNALSCVTGSDDFCGSQSEVTWNYTPGVTYYILVHGWSTNSGSFTLNLSQATSSTVTPTVASLPTITGQCSASVISTPTATSSCAGTINATTSSPTSFTAQGTYTITWNYNDGLGGVASQTQTVVVDDVTAPVPNVASLAAVNSSCAVTSLTAPTASDNCVGTVTATSSASFPITASTTVTWTYDDGNGNTSTQTQQVNVSDVIAPVPNIANLAAVNSPCGPVTSLTAPTATDNCSGTITATTNAILPITGNTTVVWTYTDASGNSITQNQTVQAGDNVAPVPNNTNLPPVNSSCAVSSLTAPTATDNCSGTVTATTGVSLPITSSTLITWNYVDANGNTSSQTQQVNVSDVIAPVPNVASLPVVNSVCSPVTSLNAPTASDNCSGTIVATTTTTFPITSNTTVVWTYTDAAGNSVTQNQLIQTGDAVAPVPTVASLPAINSPCGPVTSLTPPTATDNCSGTLNGTTTTTFPITANTTVIWTYTDAAGNSVTQNQLVTAGDGVAPVPNQPSLAAINSACAVTSLTAPTATDNCAGSITATSSVSLPINSSTTITWTYNDGNGNTTTQTQQVTISDLIAPVPNVVNLPAINSSCAPVNNIIPPTATDNCSGTITGTTTTTFPITGNTTVVWTFTDAAGNSVTQNQLVQAGDNVAPVPTVASLPAINSSCAVTSLTAPTATDNCAGTITATSSVSLPINASTTITWTYNDGNGNTSSQTQLISVSDLTAPVPDVANLPTVNSLCTSVANLTPPTATDNCSGTIIGTTTAVFPIVSNTTVVWTFTDASGNTTTQNQLVQAGDAAAPVPTVASLPVINSACAVTSLTAPTATDNCSGIITGTTSTQLPITSSTSLTWIYQDQFGNVSVQTQNVTVSDQVAPVPNVASLPSINGSCSVTSLTPPTATDNCSGAITGVTNTPLPITSNTTVTWTYTDASGNSSTQTQQVTVSDQVAPVPNVASLPSINGSCSVTSLTPPTATDNCSGAITGTTNTPLPITSNTTITWTYTDASGNSSTQTQSVVIDDVTAPVPDAQNLAAIDEFCEVLSIPAPTATDGCEGTIIGTTTTTFPITSSMVVTWTFTDSNNNSSTQTQQVNIQPVSSTLNLIGQTLSIVNPTPNATYQWIDCNNGNAPINGETNSSFTPVTSGSYAVVVSYGNCSETSACSTVNVSGLESIEKIAFRVYPNPADNMLTINVPEDGIIELYDVTGKIIWSSEIQSGKHEISVDEFATGNYNMRFKSDKFVTMTKLIIR